MTNELALHCQFSSVQLLRSVRALTCTQSVVTCFTLNALVSFFYLDLE